LQADLEALTGAFVERYGEGAYRAERERTRSVLSFCYDVELDIEPQGLFFHVAGPETTQRMSAARARRQRPLPKSG
jgi:hypothetical protein